MSYIGSSRKRIKMWMVVSEDASGRLRYQYHNLPPPAAAAAQPPSPPPLAPPTRLPSNHPSTPLSSSSSSSIYSSTSPLAHRGRMQRFARGGCLSFPDPMGASPRSNSRNMTMPSEGYYQELEQYDNVNDYSSYHGPDSSSSTSSSAEYQEPVYSTRYGGSTGNYARRQNYARCYVPITPDAFYYYHQHQQQPQTSRPRQYRAPSPDPDYSPPLSRNKVRFQLPDEPISRGEYVSSAYLSHSHIHNNNHNHNDYGDEEDEYETVSMNPDPAPQNGSVLVHRSNGQVSVMVTKKEEPIYCSGGSDSAESSSVTPSSVEADTPPPIPSHPPARHRLVKKSQREATVNNSRGYNHNGLFFLLWGSAKIRRML
uniref:Uncharacterized protein n=1 Tax=Caenorhabditis japonica TaxID=281687 RepID=A0A8R1DY26_CAEJA